MNREPSFPLSTLISNTQKLNLGMGRCSPASEEELVQVSLCLHNLITATQMKTGSEFNLSHCVRPFRVKHEQIPQPALFTDPQCLMCFLLGQQRAPAPSQEGGILLWQHPAHLKSNMCNNSRSSMDLVDQRACLVWIYLSLIIWLLQK